MHRHGMLGPKQKYYQQVQAMDFCFKTYHHPTHRSNPWFELTKQQNNVKMQRNNRPPEGGIAAFFMPGFDMLEELGAS